jgi:hypothetical protein
MKTKLKAKYILEAIAAMKEAERLGFLMEPKEFGTIIFRLMMARSDLEVNSGLRETEVEIVKEAA